MDRTPLQFAHLAPVDKFARYDEMVEEEYQALIAEGGSYYPFDVNNFGEALSNMPDAYVKVSSACFATADKLNHTGSIECAYFSIRLAVREYWEEIAQNKAKINIDELLAN